MRSEEGDGRDPEIWRKERRSAEVAADVATLPKAIPPSEGRFRQRRGCCRKRRDWQGFEMGRRETWEEEEEEARCQAKDAVGLTCWEEWKAEEEDGRN